jgi:hypothetical protein
MILHMLTLVLARNQDCAAPKQGVHVAKIRLDSHRVFIAQRILFVFVSPVVGLSLFITHLMFETNSSFRENHSIREETRNVSVSESTTMLVGINFEIL